MEHQDHQVLTDIFPEAAEAELIVRAQTDPDLEDTAEEEQLIHLHQQTLEVEEEQELSMLTHQTITHQAEEAD
jgi:hypothetical protein